MILTLESTELATLVLHMNIMRKHVRKGFKTNYGRREAQQKIKVYDEIKDEINQYYVDLESDQYELQLGKEQFDMLYSFLNWYISEIQLSATEQGANIADNEQLQLLESIKSKLQNVAEEIEVYG